MTIMNLDFGNSKKLSVTKRNVGFFFKNFLAFLGLGLG